MQNANEVVPVFEFPFVCIEAPAPHVASLSDYDAFCAGRGHLDLGGNRVRLVFGVDYRVLGQAAHSGEENLRVAVHYGWAAGEVRVRTLGFAVVEWKYVV